MSRWVAATANRLYIFVIYFFSVILYDSLYLHFHNTTVFSPVLGALVLGFWGVDCITIVIMNCKLSVPLRFYHLKEPLQFGVENATNHTISISHKDQKDHKINLWDISSNAIETDGGGVDRSCVILYCHGNSCNRAKSHRVELYKVLQR